MKNYLLAALTSITILVAPLVQAADDKKTPYVDQLIDPNRAYDESVHALLKKQQEEGGFYNFGSTAKLYLTENSDDGESGATSSLSLYGSKQSQFYGNFFGEMHLTNSNNNQGYYSNEYEDNQDIGSSFTIRQTDFALNSSVKMDNTFGAHRIFSGLDFRNTSRLSIPSPVIMGATLRANHKKDRYRISIGETGRLENPLAPAYYSTNRQTVALGGSHYFDNNWLLSTDAWGMLDSEETGNTTGGLSIMAARTGKTNRPTLLFHALTDNDGNLGLSAYGYKKFTRTEHELSIYTLTGDINWFDNQISGNRDGIYLTSRYKKGHTNLNSSLSFINSNPEHNGQQRNRKTISLSGGGSQRLSYNSSFGLSGGYSLYLQEEEPEDYTSYHYYLRASYNLTHNRRYRSRLDASHSFRDSSRDSNYNSSQSLGYELTYNYSDATEYGLSIELEQQYNNDNYSWGPSISGSINTQLAGGAWLNSSVGYSWYNSENISQQNNFYGNLGLSYPFLQNWVASVQLNYNQQYMERETETDYFYEFEQQKTTTYSSALFSLTYRFNGGSPIRPLGQSENSVGAGSIRGVVFMDENNDGKRQPQEKVASGVEVYLDRIYIAITDQRGEFSYPLVASGKHSIYVIEETLPLPWELTSRKDVEVEVNIRDTSRIDIPLQMIK